MPLELSKNLVCLYYSFVATELVLAPNNKCHSVRSRDSVTALNRAAVERRCDPSVAVRCGLQLGNVPLRARCDFLGPRAPGFI